MESQNVWKYSEKFLQMSRYPVSVTKQYKLVLVTTHKAVMLRVWEGKRRSGIVLVMHHRLKQFICLHAQDLGKGDEYHTYIPHGVW